MGLVEGLTGAEGLGRPERSRSPVPATPSPKTGKLRFRRRSGIPNDGVVRSDTARQAVRMPPGQHGSALDFAGADVADGHRHARRIPSET